jgi:hypothetical protein
MDLERLPDPEKLREIAFHIEKLRNVILPVWQTAAQDETSAGVNHGRHHVSKGSQSLALHRTARFRLRSRAEYLEEVRGL